MLKGAGTGLRSPTVNLSKLPRLSGPEVKVEAGVRAPGWLWTPGYSVPGLWPGQEGKQPAGTKGKLIRFPVVGKQPRQAYSLTYTASPTQTIAHTHTPGPRTWLPREQPQQRADNSENRLWLSRA